jgi:hypothetical protein
MELVMMIKRITQGNPPVKVEPLGSMPVGADSGFIAEDLHTFLQECAIIVML